MSIEFVDVAANIDRDYPHSCYTLQTWSDRKISFTDRGAHFGYVFTGRSQITQADGSGYLLNAGMYFSLPGAGLIGGEKSSGFVITCTGFNHAFTLGGPVAAPGEFAYIDGGRTDILLSPMRQGDPGLYGLHFPPGVDQTMHDHESDRVVLVVSGSGCCLTPDQRCDFVPGMVLRIPRKEKHKFMTFTENLSLVIFHPDSEIGFSDTNHPMLLQTYIDGISAAQLTHLHTPASLEG
jgi:mannose-6-phosphate isomerase-like protein (cupin superfamily)